MNSKCFTFYSYKGGSGRTTTLVNTTKHLTEILNATKEHPVLLVDADLESAGLTYFFNCEKKFTSRFNCTIHAEDFLKFSKNVLTGIKGDNTFGISRERFISCDSVAMRIAAFYPSVDVTKLFSGVSIRETTAQILERIVRAMENKKEAAIQNSPVNNDDAYLCSTYELYPLLIKLEATESLEEVDVSLAKRHAIEDFLPADGMIDVSDYFGRPEGSVKFIGVDVAFNGSHATLTNEKAEANKICIARECGKKGFSTVIFDCGAGVQSTAHVLNHVSDVIVYCMRPTYQFASGTLIQLSNYRDALTRIADRKNAIARDEGQTADKKSVIILPTAVPYESASTKNLQKDSFDRIGRIAGMFDGFVDATFCTYETSLKEISLFKWREHILGTMPVESDKLGADIIKAIEPYSSYGENMPNDARDAYKTYRLLAERLCYNS